MNLKKIYQINENKFSEQGFTNNNNKMKLQEFLLLKIKNKKLLITVIVLHKVFINLKMQFNEIFYHNNLLCFLNSIAYHPSPLALG